MQKFGEDTANSGIPLAAPVDLHSFAYYDWIAREVVQKKFITGDMDKKANEYFDLLLDKTFEKQVKSFPKDQIVFITVNHIVHHIPFFLRALRKLAPIAAVIPKGDSRREYRDKFPFFRCASDEWYKHILHPINREALDSFHKARAFLEKCVPTGKKAIIIDEGGYFAPFVQGLCSPQNAADKFANNCVAGVVEITKNGHFRWVEAFKSNEMRNNKIPVSSIAVSKIKEVEDQEIGEAIVRCFDIVLETDSMLTLRHTDNGVGVIGCGVIGSAVIRELERKCLHSIHIYDFDSEKMTKLKNSFPEGRIIIHQDLKTLLRASTLIISATGNHCLTAANFREDVRDDTYIACVTSVDDEMEKDALKDFSKSLKNDTLKYTSSYTNATGKRINLALDGNAVNFITHSVVGAGIYQVLSSTIACAFEIFAKEGEELKKTQVNLPTELDMGKVTETHEAIYGYLAHEVETFGLYKSTVKFVGRKKELKELEDSLGTKSYGIITGARKGGMKAIAGLGGIGKSTIAQKHAEDALQQKRYRYIIRLNATNAQTLYRDFISLATQLGCITEELKKSPRDLILTVYRSLKKYERVLIIFDDPECFDDLLTARVGGEEVRFYPDRVGFLVHCVITTRNSKFSLEGMIHLEELDLPDAVEYIIHFLKCSRVVAEELANAVHCFPLALSQVVSFILLSTESEEVSIDDRVRNYTRKYRAVEIEKRKLLSGKPAPGDLYRASVYTTWDISFEKVRAINPLSEIILNVLAYCDSSPFAIEIFRDLVPRYSSTQIFDALMLLNRYSLLDFAQDFNKDVKIDAQPTLIRTHDLLQEVVLLKQKERAVNTASKYQSMALELMYEFSKNYSETDKIISHGLRVVKHHEENPELRRAQADCHRKIQLLESIGSFQNFELLLAHEASESLILANTISREANLFMYEAMIGIALANSSAWEGNPAEFNNKLDVLMSSDNLTIEIIKNALRQFSILNYDNLSECNRLKEILLEIFKKSRSRDIVIQNLENISIDELLRVFLHPRFKSLRTAHTAQVLEGLGVYQFSIVYLIYAGKLRDAMTVANRYLEEIFDEKNQELPNMISRKKESIYLYVLTNTFTDTISFEDGIGWLNVAKEDEDEFWDHQIFFFLSVLLASKGDYVQSQRIISELCVKIAADRRNGEQGLIKTILVMEKVMKALTNACPELQQNNCSDQIKTLYGHTFRILGYLYFILSATYKKEGNEEAFNQYSDTSRQCFEIAISYDDSCTYTRYQYGLLLAKLFKHSRNNQDLELCFENLSIADLLEETKQTSDQPESIARIGFFSNQPLPAHVRYIKVLPKHLRAEVEGSLRGDEAVQLPLSMMITHSLAIASAKRSDLESSSSCIEKLSGSKDSELLYGRFFSSLQQKISRHFPELAAQVFGGSKKLKQ